MITLNDEQERVRTTIEGALFVNSGFGTGKTEVMAQRTAYAIEHGISPRNILCLTFTNKAADELKSRIQKYVGKNINELSVYTFHSFCFRILSKYSSRINFTIIDDSDATQLVEAICTEMKFDLPVKKEYYFHNMVKAFIAIYKLALHAEKAENIESIKEYFRKAVMASDVSEKNTNLNQDFRPQEIYNLYHEKLQQINCLDFNDLLIETKKILSKHSDVLSSLCDNYQWIQVDETQDINIVQYNIVYLLAMSGKKNIALFGDENQTIYTWCGSSPRKIFSHFKKKFSPIEIHLSQCYRNTKVIYSSAQSFLKNDTQKNNTFIMKEGNHKDMIIHEEHTLEDETLFVATVSKELHEVEHIPYSEMAIIVRRKKTGESIAEILKIQQVPYFMPDEFKIFEYPEIKTIVSWFRLVLNKNDGIALKRIWNIPEEFQKQLEKLNVGIEDFLTKDFHRDMYQSLFTQYETNEIVCFDIETTGLDFATDDMIEISAILFGKNGVQETMSYLVKTERDFDESLTGITKEKLLQEGIDCEESLKHFIQFIKGRVVIGYNIMAFDCPFLETLMRKHHIEFVFDYAKIFDVYTLYKRFYKSIGYKLEIVCRENGIINTSAHRALSDCKATVDIFEKTIMPQIKKSADERVASFQTELFQEQLELSTSIKNQIDELCLLSEDVRPDILLENLVNKIYPIDDRDEKLRRRLEKIQQFFTTNDKSDLPPILSLRNIISFSTFSEVYKLNDDNKISILTAHKVKGMEFQVVFVMGMNQGEFPNYRSHDEAEEKRVFYVALTRAKTKVYLTYSKYEKIISNNEIVKKEKKPSQYLKDLSTILLSNQK